VSLRDDILAADDAKVVALEVPEWKRTVHLRVMSGSERDRFEAGIKPDPKSGRVAVLNLRARFAVLVVCDETGKRIFTDADADLLGKKSAAALDRIMEAGSVLNGITEAEVQTLEGKSESGQSVDSGTSSP
jgi:hypothetical protein